VHSQLRLLGRNVKDKTSVDFHFLVVLLALEFQTVDVLLGAHDFGAIEGCCVWIAGKHLLSNREGWQNRAGFGNWDQRRSGSLVDSALFTVFVGLGVLDIVSKSDVLVIGNEMDLG
jgi:hypothetical protein